jgi:hypothetical protein
MIRPVASNCPICKPLRRPTTDYGARDHAVCRSNPLDDQLSAISKLVALGLAATPSSPIRQHPIAYSAADVDTNQINQLWLVTYRDATGLQIIARARPATGNYTPSMSLTKV